MPQPRWPSLMSPHYYACIFYAFSAIQHDLIPWYAIACRKTNLVFFLIFDYEHLLISCTCMILWFLSWYPQTCMIVFLCTQLITHLNIKNWYLYRQLSLSQRSLVHEVMLLIVTILKNFQNKDRQGYNFYLWKCNVLNTHGRYI